MIDKSKLHELVDQLDESTQKSALDFLRYLVEQQSEIPFDAKEFFERLPEDDEPLSPTEVEQLAEANEFVSWEVAKRELQIDRKSK